MNLFWCYNNKPILINNISCNLVNKTIHTHNILFSFIFISLNRHSNFRIHFSRTIFINNHCFTCSRFTCLFTINTTKWTLFIRNFINIMFFNLFFNFFFTLPVRKTRYCWYRNIMFLNYECFNFLLEANYKTLTLALDCPIKYGRASVQTLVDLFKYNGIPHACVTCTQPSGNIVSWHPRQYKSI